jgi:DNA-3-methyladenine glycosylase
MKLPLSFYRREDVVEIAKDLLGKFLFTKIEGVITGGKIVETESYKGIHDKASHAYGGRFTERTKTLYESGGVTYVYLCYGMHYLLNIVTNKKNFPHGVLIRAIEPIIGFETMLKRRRQEKISFSLTSGPGALTEALGITKNQNQIKLTNSIIWIEDRNLKIEKKQIIESPRVGVDYAEEDAFLPWRFRIAGNKWTSRAK